MNSFWPYLVALIPSAGIGFLFWLIVKNMIEGDRKERLAHSQWEREHDTTSGPEQSTDKASSD